jgi:sugar phosphate isomerase/epimerase
MKPIGLQLYTLRDLAEKDPISVLKTVAKIGYKGVETAGLYGMKPEEFRKIVEDLGMQVCSAHMAFPTAENQNEIIETALGLGIKMVGSGLGPDDFLSRDSIRAAAQRVQYAQQTLAAKGLIFYLHNHWWEFEPFEDKLGYDYFLESCPKAWFEIDAYWAANFGQVDPARQVRRFKGRTILLHIKDGNFARDPAYHVAVGSGKIDVPAVIQAADPNVLKWIIVELDECATDMVQAVAESYQYLVSNGLAAGNK